MDTVRPARSPWKSWSDFAAWAQDFSLRKKVLGGFLAVVVLVGLLTSLIGTRLARDTIMDRARRELMGDLATAGFILKNTQENLELKVRLWSGSERIEESLAKGDVEGIRNRLATVARENDVDFLSITDDKGRVIARAFVPQGKTSTKAFNDPVVSRALQGKNSAGVRVMSSETLSQENPALGKRLGKAKEGLVLEAAHPLTLGRKTVGALYGGRLLNHNEFVVNRMARQIFRDPSDEIRAIGHVTIFSKEQPISTTLQDDEGKPLLNMPLSYAIREKVLNQGKSEVSQERLQGKDYLAAAEPILDVNDNIVGAIQVATLERPIVSVIDRLVYAFSVVALFGVLLMAGISYFLVNWINRPLEQMLHAAKRAAEGDLSHEVPVIARDEIGELAATFNLMIRNLAESQNKLEEWGKQLATKVAEQSGELNQVREQVARVKKLASLEKMADGMAHLMAHISDPMVGASVVDESRSSTSRVLILDIDERVLDICERILVSEGFEVKLCRSVNEALQELETEFFDVVVADIEMPEMGGKELLREIKNRQPEVTVILTAPFKATEEAVEAVKLGAYDYIPKPFGPHQILLMVYTALQTRQMIERTRRQHAEQRAEAIFQRLPVAIALADKHHRVVYHNRAFVELASENHQEPVPVQGKTFKQLFGEDPLDQSKTQEEIGGSRWLQLENVKRTAKLYNFKLPEEDLRVLMLLDVTETVMKDQQADVFKAETITKAHQVIHQQMRVAQEIAGLLGETTAETKAALFELIKLAREGEAR